MCKTFSDQELTSIYKLAGHHLMPFIAASFKEGYNLMVDEAVMQQTVPMTSSAGGLRRFYENKLLAPFQFQYNIEIDDIDQLYCLEIQDSEDKAKVIINEKVEKVEHALIEKLDQILEKRKNSYEQYQKEYKKAAKEAMVQAYKHSFIPMITNYFALAIADKNILTKVGTKEDIPHVDELKKIIVGSLNSS